MLLERMTLESFRQKVHSSPYKDYYTREGLALIYDYLDSFESHLIIDSIDQLAKNLHEKTLYELDETDKEHIVAQDNNGIFIVECLKNQERGTLNERS